MRTESQNSAGAKALMEELEAFVASSGRMPSASSGDPKEKRLRNRVDNASRGKGPRLDGEQAGRIRELKDAYGRRHAVSLAEEVAYAERFCAEHGRMPRLSDADPRARRCAERVARALCEGRVPAGLRGRLDALRKRYGRYSYADAGEFVADYVAFTRSEGRVPLRGSADLLERRLAVDLYRFRPLLSDAQRLAVEGARGSARPSGRVSYSEKILAEGLLSALERGGGEVVGLNRRVGGREADILLESPGGGRVAVQYDGGVHAHRGALEADLAADAAMLGEGVSVVRVREPNAPAYAEREGTRVVLIGCALCEMDGEGLSAALADVMDAAGLAGDAAAVDWAEARRRASSSSSVRVSAARSAARYAELLILGRGDRDELRRVKNRLRAACRRGAVPPDALRLLAWMESNLDCGRGHFFGDAAMAAGLSAAAGGMGGVA